MSHIDAFLRIPVTMGKIARLEKMFRSVTSRQTQKSISFFWTNEFCIQNYAKRKKEY